MTGECNRSQIIEGAIAIYNGRLDVGDNHRAAFMAAVAFVSIKYPERDLKDISNIITEALNVNVDEIDNYRL